VQRQIRRQGRPPVAAAVPLDVALADTFPSSSTFGCCNTFGSNSTFNGLTKFNGTPAIVVEALKLPLPL
jgi:hypothetical protein